MHKTRQTLDPFVGQWWRFTRYELKDGYIRPTPDAELSAYDPWRDSRQGMRKAYASLATLVRRGQDAGGHGTLTPDTEAEVLAWCRRYGLLGILLQRVEQVVLPPWTEVETALLREETDTEELEQYQIQVQFRRNPMGWQKMRTQDVIGDGELPSHDPAGVTLHAIDALETVCEPFGKTWARFFPAVPRDQCESYPYPPPLSQEFWALYQEPVEDFFCTAAELARVLTALATGGAAVSDRQARPNAVDDDALAIHALNAYVSTVRWCLAPTQDGMVQRWASPSFFASLAMMILQDVAGKTRPRICRTCGRVFVSSAYQARYCSPRCRHTMNKRVFRRKAARKQSPRQKGQATRGQKG